MKKRILIISLVTAFLIIAFLLVILILNNAYDYKKGQNNHYDGKGQKAIIQYNGEILSCENVKIYNEDIEVFYGETYIINVTFAHMPLLPILKHIGAKVNWLTKNIAVIILENEKYVLNLNNRTFKKMGEWQDMAIPAPGTEVFYCHTVGKDIILDNVTVKCILEQINVSCHIDIDTDNLVVRVKTS